MRNAALLALAAVAPAASAGTVVLFDNLTPGYTRDKWLSVLRDSQPAVPFVASVDADLASIELPLTQNQQGTFSYIVRLYAADPGDPGIPGGAPLAEWHGVPGGLATVAPTAAVALRAGAKYFVAVDVPDTRTNYDRGWHHQLEEYRAPMAAGYPGNWASTEHRTWWPAMRVLGETSVPAVPEPATLALGALALASAAARRRRR